MLRTNVGQDALDAERDVIRFALLVVRADHHHEELRLVALLLLTIGHLHKLYNCLERSFGVKLKMYRYANTISERNFAI